MVETEWPELEGTELEYSGQSWECTGTVEVGTTGNQLSVEAREGNDVRGRTAMLQFTLGDGSPSLNPGNLGSHHAGLEPAGETYRLRVADDPRTYRYELQGITYE
ncbi:hypothetical protein [Natronolimnohabitans innermongolicus]|uniref:Uncharacterized protein n=1 Tax=Natronolimnohabitans innermongolicus JCM 12255 TaxID=1227499 RepID=L9WNG4_9EURY|nr:hypothetical protein [Natronolimnohabitans innermongolicus]ELY50989.1 hypothetical protein C493_18426 [Natronolimnohabitans innermongolicus JCM 12255]